MKLKPGTVLSILSFSISLFVLGVYLIILVHVSNLVEIINEKTPFIVELADSLSNESLKQLENDLKSKDFVFEIIYISKKDGLKLLEEELGSNVLLDSEQNPLKDIVRFKLKNSFIESDKVDSLISELELKKEIEKCTFEKESVEGLKTNLMNLNSILLFLGLVFIFISFILIYNNLKFILHADRFTIKTMELIGASPSFVKRPYIKLSLKIGVFSGIFAVLLLLIVFAFLHAKYDVFTNIVDINSIMTIMFIILIISIILPPLFINSLVKKYLIQSDSSRYN